MGPRSAPTPVMQRRRIASPLPLRCASCGAMLAAHMASLAPKLKATQSICEGAAPPAPQPPAPRPAPSTTDQKSSACRTSVMPSRHWLPKPPTPAPCPRASYSRTCRRAANAVRWPVHESSHCAVPPSSTQGGRCDGGSDPAGGGGRSGPSSNARWPAIVMGVRREERVIMARPAGRPPRAAPCNRRARTTRRRGAGGRRDRARLYHHAGRVLSRWCRVEGSRSSCSSNAG